MVKYVPSMNELELLSPAGSFETALAAFAAGADAVYLGLDAFSARADAVNFSTEELRDLIAFAHQANNDKKVYVTFNTLLDDAQLPSAVEKLAILEELRPDALIVQDLGIARLVRRHFPSLEIHASTQLVAHNLESVLALKELGFTRVVLARELSVEDIRSITKRCGCEIEVFVHGALCYSLSGLCLFSAMEKNRSGNRGKCAYCCRLAYTDAAGNRTLPFSMRDLRLDAHLEQLRDAGVASLKIEGRMKSALYVSTVTAHYREILDGLRTRTSRADLETVFSRRTTTLYADGYPKNNTPTSPVIDPSSLGHLGTPIGAVKRLTKDREGRTWLRFHTSRALEKHDGLQFAAEGSKPYGFGISEMRTALSRSAAFSVPANSDVEILVPEEREPNPALTHGATIYCSASNEVKRRFPVPSFRPSDVPSGTPVNVHVSLTPNGIYASANFADVSVTVNGLTLTPSQHPERTEEAVRKAFSRMGGTTWSLGALTLDDTSKLFAPASALNELRRQLIEKLDVARIETRATKIANALSDESITEESVNVPTRTLKLRIDQTLPDDTCDYDEVIVAIGNASGKTAEAALTQLIGDSGITIPTLRLALPVFTFESDFNTLRSAVKHLFKLGYAAWETCDLAGVRLLHQVGITDITADWSLYALNRESLAQLAELGISRCVTSPENTQENLQFLADRKPGIRPTIEFLKQQTTPLFISLTRPETEDPSLLTALKGDTFMSYPIGNLWVTSRTEMRRFRLPGNTASTRIDLSWDF